MSGSQFGIFSAVREGYMFAGREWRYLARLALLPLGIDLLSELLMFSIADMDKISAFERATWTLPAMTVIGWFMFLMTRLQLLGERTGQLPADPLHLATRRRNMSLSVIVFLLLYMGFVTLISIWGMPGADMNFGYSVASMLACGAAIWGTRMGVAHILAAVDFPIRKYVRQVNGLAISFRLIALSLLCLLPVLLGGGIFATMFMDNSFTVVREAESGLLRVSLTPAGIVFNVVFSFVFLVLLNAAGTAALRQLMKKAAA